MKRVLLPMALMIMGVIVAIIIIICICLITLLKSNEPAIAAQETVNQNHRDFSKVEKIDDRNELLKIKNILNTYYEAIRYLDADIKDLNVTMELTSQEEQETIEEYSIENIDNKKK